jgi:hypothetical protein
MARTIISKVTKDRKYQKNWDKVFRRKPMVKWCIGEAGNNVSVADKPKVYTCQATAS